MKSRSATTPLRQGFTVAELLVSMAIVGMLLSILVPAVQRVRDRGRLATCSNNLHQVGVAIHGVETRHGAIQTRYDDAWRQLLPGLEQSALAERINDSIAPGEFTAEVLACPQDTWADFTIGWKSYEMNDGTRFRNQELDRNGFVASIESRGLRRFRDITDGASSTAMVSEHLVDCRTDGSPIPISDLSSAERRILGFTPQPILGYGQETQFVQACRTQRQLPTVQVQAWVHPGFAAYRTYDHLLTPNALGCWNGPESGFSMMHLAVPATSLHFGGVNVLICDGGVDFVSETIDLSVWSAVGTIAGAEVHELVR